MKKLCSFVFLVTSLTPLVHAGCNACRVMPQVHVADGDDVSSNENNDNDDENNDKKK